MKKTINLIFILIPLLSVLTRDSNRISTSQAYQKFIRNEQRALKNLESGAEDYKMLTGVQFAALQDYYKTLDPEELRVPMERLQPAFEDVMDRKSRLRRKSMDGFVMNWEELDANAGGRTRAVMWDPNDTEKKKVWAAGVTGGLWYRTDIFDDNERWQIISDFWEGLSVSCIDYDPVNSMTFYAGTGEGQTARIIYRESTGRGFGILKSPDGGDSWEILESTRDFAYVTDLIVREEDGVGVIYAGVISGRYQSEIYGDLSKDGLYRSSDGGENWTQVLPNIPETDHSYAPSDIELTSDGKLFVGTGISLDETGAGRILSSVDGINWLVYDEFAAVIESQPEFNYPGRVVLTSSMSDANRIYAFMTAAAGEFYSFKSPWGMHLLKSSDAGASWTEAVVPSRSGGPPDGRWAYIAWHALSAGVNPGNPDKLYAGGLNMHTSSDGGSTWAEVSSWYNFDNSDPNLPGYVHADQHSVKFRPGSTQDALFTTDGGVFLTRNAEDIVPDFAEKNHGYNTLQHYTCAIHPEAGRRYFLAGAQDNGSFRYDEDNDPIDIFDYISLGDGTLCFIDEDDPNFQISSSHFNYLYTTNLHLLYGYMENVPGIYGVGIFINPMDFDYVNDILYANTCNFYGERADTIMRVYNVKSAELSINYIAMNTGTTVPFSAIKVAPTNSSIVYAGTQDGRLYKINNADYLIGNKDPYEITEIGSNEFPRANIVCIETGINEDQILVIFSNYGVSSVWESVDGGNSWTDKEANLPDIPVRWGIYHPANSKQVLLATEIGLWSANHFNTEEFVWEPVENFPNVRVDMIRARKSDNAVVAATHGRGLWYSSSYPLFTEEIQIVTNKMKVYPNPSMGLVNIDMGSIQDEKLSLGIFDMNGREVQRIYQFINSGESLSSFDNSTLVPGNYILKLSGKKVVYEGFMIVGE